MAGSKVHKLLEEWVKDDIQPPAELLWDRYDLGRMAWALGAKLPDKSRIRQSEEKFEVTLYGVPFTGIIDLQTDESVIDFKTTSQIQYVKSYEELTFDPQRLLYIAAKPDKTRTLWSYGVWRDFSVHVREFAVDAVVDRERFKLHVLKPAEEILALAHDVDPLSLPPNKDACGLFPPNGCPHKSKCFPSNKTAARMTKLMDKLKQREVTQVGIPTSTANIDLINSPETGNKEASPAPLVEQKQREPQNDEKPIEFLFVDAYPLAGVLETVYAATVFIANAARSVAADNHVPNALLIPYSQGAVMIATQLEADLKGKSYKYVYLETKSSEGRAVLHTLMNNSRVVIKGMI